MQSWVRGRTIVSVTKKPTHLAKLADLHFIELHDLLFSNVDFLKCGDFSPVESDKITCCGQTFKRQKPIIANQMAREFGEQFQSIYIKDASCATHLKENGFEVIDPIDLLMEK